MPLPPVLFEDDAVIAFDKPGSLLPAPDRAYVNFTQRKVQLFPNVRTRFIAHEIGKLDPAHTPVR